MARETALLPASPGSVRRSGPCGDAVSSCKDQDGYVGGKASSWAGKRLPGPEETGDGAGCRSQCDPGRTRIR